jgi:MSHA biogenesis protein MshQ
MGRSRVIWIGAAALAATLWGGNSAWAVSPTPLAQWHMDQSSWSGTSGEVVDSSGNGYNGVAEHGATTNGVTPALSGTPGTCFYGTFNGSTQYVQLPTSLPHLGTNSTITAWIQPTAAGTAGYGGRIFWDDYNLNGFLLSFGDPGNNELTIVTRGNYNYVDSTISLTVNSWYFVVAEFSTSGSTYYIYLKVYDASGTLLDSESSSKTASWSPGTGPYATIGGDADTSQEGAHARFQGNIDEVTLYNSALTNTQLSALVLATHTCISYAPDHYAISAASTAVNCQATPVTIAAHTSTHAAFATTDTIAITTSTGHGDWTLTTGSGTFAAGSSNSGSASYTYVQADDGSAVLSLRDTYAETVTINVTDGTATAKSGSALASEDSPITFAPSGFRITNGSNVATTIGTQSAGVTSTTSLALQAVRTDTNTGACTTVFASGTTVSVSLAYQCNNPTSCVAGQAFSLTNNGTTTTLASNPNSALTSYTTVPLKFTTANGEAPIAVLYTDAGQISLAAKYSIPLGSGAASGNTMNGSSQFVVQPYTLKLSTIKLTSSGAANPAASSASGTVFGAAGQAVTATVTAQNYQGSATPNFGQETSPAAVTLTPNLVLPTSGHNPAVTGTFGTYTSGVATGTAFSWPEVGIITLTPAVASYLGSGTVTGTTTGNVGRFIPNAFATAVTTTPVFGTPCIVGGFGYVGQPFTYTVAPAITTTALAVGGTTTQNYTGSLMRLTNSSLTGRTYTPTPVSPALTLSGLPATSADPAIVDLGASQSTLAGQSTLTFSAGSGLSFSRGGAIAPFTANIALSINVIDLDGVVAANPANPVTIGSGSGIAFSTSTNQYYGRLALRDSLGSELLDVPMPLTTQYYLNTTLGFVTNTVDSCSAAPAIAFSNNTLALSGTTCVRDSGSPGVSGQGCAAAASSPYSPTASAGSFNLILAAPGANHTGTVTVGATAPTWLQYLWNAGSGSNSSPSGMATFGEFPGSVSRVYQRQVY